MEPLIALALLAAMRRGASAATPPARDPAAPGRAATPGTEGWVWPYPELDAAAASAAGVRPSPVVTDGPGPGKRRRADGTLRWHEGVDLFYPRLLRAERPSDGGSRAFYTPPGTPVLAVADGRVWSARRTSRGWRVVIDHGRPWSSVYTHLERLDIPEVDAANRNTVEVRAGQQLGTAGADPQDAQGLRHLHFELHRDGKWIDPRDMMRRWRRVSSAA